MPRPHLRTPAVPRLGTTVGVLALVLAPTATSAGPVLPTSAGAVVADVAIPAIQGAGHRSPRAGEEVTTTGVVTARKFDGYWVQDPHGDGDDTTSDGIYVFTRASGAKPDVGQVVRVTGEVAEFRPGGSSGPNLAGTEIDDSTFTVVAEDADLPVPVLIGRGGRTAPAQQADGAIVRTDIETAGAYAPDRDALDFYESLEGMLVEVSEAEVVGPRNDFGEFVVLPGDSKGLQRTHAGGVRYGSYANPNTQRITIDDEIIFRQMPPADVGDTLPGPVSGPLSYNFGMVRLFPTAVPQVMSGSLAKETTKPQRPGELAIATFNVENLDPGDGQETFARLAETVVDHLAAPDVLALEEVQDDTGAECPDGPTPTCTPDGVVDAGRTLDLLAEAIRSAGGPSYDWRQISPANLTDGGEPTGNIRVAFLFRTDRGLRFVDRPGGDATTSTGVQDLGGGRAALTLSPGRIDPASPAWNSSRKPLAGEFTFRGERVIVIANHFSSKSGDEPLMGRWQPPRRSSETQRHAQAAEVNDFVAGILDVQKDANVVVVGDFNDFEFSDTTRILERGEARHGKALVSLPRLLPPRERYSYVFDGNSQVLDQILVSPGVLLGAWPRPFPRLRGYDIVHVNAEFADQVSDHDPQVVRLVP
jgi:uncharacterized protein